MTQTLRRELRMKFEEVLHRGAMWTREKLAEELADAALDVRGMNFKPQTIEAAIFAGVPVTKDMVQDDTPLTDFERVFGFGALPWRSNTVWEKFTKFILNNSGWFQDYVNWRNGDGKYKAFSNRKIRENPQAFMDTGYPEYEASKMYRKTDETRPAYAPIPERVRTPRPANVPPPVLPKRSLNDNPTDRE